MNRFFFIVLTLWSLNVFGQTHRTAFKVIYDLIEQKNFFKAKGIYDLKKTELSAIDQKVVTAFLDNAFNRLEESNKNITQIIKTENKLSDSLILELYKVKEDNSVKLFDYKAAKNTLQYIFKNYNKLLSEKDKDDMENDLKIWTALEPEAKQHVSIKEMNRLSMTKDKAGLNNLKVSAGKDTVNFIFDTGANLSTVSATVAKKLNMKIIPVNIDVGTITGEDVLAQLAVCPLLKLGNIEIHNAIFLVMENKELHFAEIDYQINGILGFPVIEALHEIQITQDGYFIVPIEETKIKHSSNMAMDGLTPLIYIDGKHFSFDTGANNSILYHSYYVDNQVRIDSSYKPTKVGFAGAGSKREFDGYIISQDFNILDKNITLKDIRLLKEKVKSSETVYGNIGLDLIRSFNKMTLNFNHMFIKFD